MRVRNRTITGQRFRALAPNVARMALVLVRQYEDDYAQYLDAAEASRRDYRGRKVYRASHCEHGTSLWTDYDNICGGCEDGYTMGDAGQRRARAIAEAKERQRKADALYDVLAVMKRHEVDFDRSAYMHIIARVLTPGESY